MSECFGRAVLCTPQLLVAVVLTALCGCSAGGSPSPAAGTLVERARVSMGSELRLTAWTQDEAAGVAAFEAAFAEFERLEGLLSVWREGSDVQRLNAAAGRGPVRVSAETREVLGMARLVSEWTGGKFDVTFGALSDLWKFDHDQDNRIPPRAEIARRLPLVDYTAVSVDDRAGTASIAREGVRVHLGGIGKGFAVDRAVSILRARGLRDFMIQAGGDLYVAGRRGDRSWRTGIRDPRGPQDHSFAAIDLTDAAISTSGDYERFFLRDGRRYHHILDPDSGEPARGSRSATVVAQRAMLADALATGVFIAGPEAGLALIERLSGVEGVIVTAGNNLLVSSGLSGHFALLAPPTSAP